MVLAPNPRELTRLVSFVQNFSHVARLEKDAAFALDLALTEWVTNVITHGFATDQSGQIEVSLRSDSSGVYAETQDTGRPFDPLLAPRIDITVPLEQKVVGGLGIHLIRQYMDELSYERANGKNRFLMHKSRTKSGDTEKKQ